MTYGKRKRISVIALRYKMIGLKFREFYYLSLLECCVAVKSGAFTENDLACRVPAWTSSYGIQRPGLPEYYPYYLVDLNVMKTSDLWRTLLPKTHTRHGGRT